MQSARKNHPWERIFVGRDAISEEESSLGENFCWQRCNQQKRIIPGREFLSAGMKSARKNHPGERIFVGRDAISREESSPEENFCWQRCNQQRRIIPGREFLLAEMQSAEKNHPRKRILIRKGCNQRERIIPERNFLSAGMQSARKNHPGERIFIRRDAINREESSLREIFYWQG